MMMWLWLSVISALLLGMYDVVKKLAVRNNGVLEVLFCATGLSALLLAPVLISSISGRALFPGELWQLDIGTLQLHLKLFLKSIIVTVSWICGIVALKHLPITTVGIVKASRPVFILLGCLLIFGERLNIVQWAGVSIAIAALYLLSRSSKDEGIVFRSNKWVWCLFGAVVSGVVSALIDKYLMKDIQPLFVQSWCDLYITLILAVCIVLQKRFFSKGGGKPSGIRWDWNLLLIALFITASDFCYFQSLTIDGSLLSVISMIRRSSVLVTFVFGAVLFHENRLRAKGLEMLLLLAGIALLMIGSY